MSVEVVYVPEGSLSGMSEEEILDTLATSVARSRLNGSPREFTTEVRGVDVTVENHPSDQRGGLAVLAIATVGLAVGYLAAATWSYYRGRK